MMKVGRKGIRIATTGEVYRNVVQELSIEECIYCELKDRICSFLHFRQKGHLQQNCCQFTMIGTQQKQYTTKSHPN